MVEGNKEGANNPEKIVEGRIKKIKLWLKNPSNLAFLGLIIFAIVIRLYYFFMTKNQPLWWDEADYMAYAKNLAGFNTQWIVTSQHNSLLPFIAAFMILIGFSEAIIRFVIEIIPSIVVVYLTYEICILMYKSKKIALMCGFLIAAFWELLFNSMRLHVEGPALLFGFLAMYTFWKGYENREKIFGFINSRWAIPITVVLVLITYSFRRGYFVFGLFFLIYMFLTRRFKELIKDKYNWIALFVAIALLLVVEKFIFISPIAAIASLYYTHAAVTFTPLQVFGSYFENLFSPSLSILLYLFYLGIAVMIIRIFLISDKIKELKDDYARGDIFALITIIVVLAYFIFYAKIFGEPRWYYPLLLGSLICISRGIIFIADFVKKYSKYISVFILIGLVGFGGYYELQHANYIIKNKVSSFEGIKEAGLFIKGISNVDDVILSVPMPQPAYYAEREAASPWLLLNKSDNSNTTLEEFLTYLHSKEGNSVKYLIVTFSEPNHPSWMRKDTYAQTQTGQAVYATWEIPFMNTTINFINGKQDIKSFVKYGDITFRLLTVKQDAFVYGIERS